MITEMIVSAAMSLGGPQDPQLSPPSSPSLLISSNDVPAATINQIELTGSGIGNLPSYRLTLKSDNHMSVISLQIENLEESTIIINDRQFPRLDLSTLSTGYRQEGSGSRFRITIAYGSSRPDCFLNHDGRNSLSIDFVSGQFTEANALSLEHCSSHYQTVTKRVLVSSPYDHGAKH